MAARRLLILMVAVLVVSTIAAALIAPRPTPEGGETTTRTATQPPGLDEASTGRLIEESVQITSRRPEAVPMRVGDQLELTVRARTPVQVEIPRLGMLEDAEPDAPAHFSVLPSEAGRLEVRIAGGRTVAVIRVTEPEAEEKLGRGRERLRDDNPAG